MKIEISGKPEFHFPLTLAQIDVLVRLSRVHYDGTCRAASDPSEHWPHGFIARWRAQVENAGEGYKVRGAFRDLDLCLKIMENPPPYIAEKHMSEIAELRRSFNAALTAANAVYKSWYEEVN